MQIGPSETPGPASRRGRLWQLLIALTLGVVLLFAAAAATAGSRRAIVLEVDGVIGPAMADYLVREIAKVTPADTGIVILRMDTPGGLDTSMREIIRTILASPVPVATYVAPGGARAASAGTYITYASAVAAMAPGTNLGAATPIQFGGPPLAPGGSPEPAGPPGSDKPKDKTSDKPRPAAQSPSSDKAPSAAIPEPADTETRKILNDAVAYIRSLAELNGRNADWATEAVRSAVSLPASDALKLHVIDVIADDIPDLLRKIDGRTVVIAGKTGRLATADLEIVTIAPDWRTQLLTVITNPNIAYILMLIGIYGLFFEFSNPGMVLPGVIGGISLLLALFALNLLPIDYAGAGLVLLGIALMVAEAFIGSFGVIGLGGITAFAIGSIIMFHAGAPGFGLSLAVVIAATVVTAGFFLLILTLLLRSRRRRVITGKEALIAAEGEVVTWQDAHGRVLVLGEIWLASASSALRPGTRIKVISRDGLVLTVQPI